MSAIIKIFTSVAIFAWSVEAIGEKCTSNAFCSGSNVYCKITSPTCGSGICSCMPGFGIDASDGTCKRTTSLAGYCSADNGICTTEHSFCNHGRCLCERGYKMGPKGDDCVPNTATETHGGKCYDSIQCYYNMKCINNACGCFSGYTNDNKYECRPRRVGDGCASGDDCSRLLNTDCLSGTCQCTQGYKRAQYMTSATESILVCIPMTASLVGEGGACNSTLDYNAEGLLCEKPFVCTQCGTDKMVCARLTAVYAGAERSIPSFYAAIFTLLAATLIF